LLKETNIQEEKDHNFTVEEEEDLSQDLIVSLAQETPLKEVNGEISQRLESTITRKRMRNTQLTGLESVNKFKI